MIPIVVSALGTAPRRTVGNLRDNRNDPNHSIVEIGQRNGKNLGVLREFAVNQTPVKTNKLTRV